MKASSSRRTRPRSWWRSCRSSRPTRRRQAVARIRRQGGDEPGRRRGVRRRRPSGCPPTAINSYFFDKTTGQKIVVDWRDARPGDKQYHWEQRGVPFRMEVGPRDVAAGAFVSEKPPRPRQGDRHARRGHPPPGCADRWPQTHAAMLGPRPAYRDAEHAHRRHLRRAEKNPGRPRRFRPLLLQTRPRQRSEDQGRNQGHRPLHPPGPSRRPRQMHLHRRSHRYPSHLRPGVLTPKRIDARACKTRSARASRQKAESEPV